MSRLGSLALLGMLFSTPVLADPPPPDAGTPTSTSTTTLSQEDQEVVDNLDLLENLDAAKELDTMLALAQAEDSDSENDAGK